MGVQVPTCSLWPGPALRPSLHQSPGPAAGFRGGRMLSDDKDKATPVHGKFSKLLQATELSFSDVLSRSITMSMQQSLLPI